MNTGITIGNLQTSGALWEVDAEGRAALRFARMEVSDLAISTPLGSVRAAAIELADVSIRLPVAAPTMVPSRISTVTIGELRVKDAKVEPHGIAPRASPGARTAWRLEPLASLTGTLRAEVVDAAWLFDADITIPINVGAIDFNRATVEHVGPDSSLGVDRKGVYIDAPNGRIHLFLWPATIVPGVEFERSHRRLTRFRTAHRGAIQLRPLLESLLAGTPIGTLAVRVRDLLSRTRVSGTFRLGDGVVGDERRRIVLSGRGLGRNHVELSPGSGGRGVLLRILDLLADELRMEAFGAVVCAGELSASLSMQVSDAATTPIVLLSVADLAVREIRLQDGES